jgi:outer membrane protein OmpA-like peptidoglycan-associated protein
VIWGVNGGAMIQRGVTFAASRIGTSLTFGGGVAILAAGDKLQIGPEIYGSTLLDTGKGPGDVGPFNGRDTNLEAILGIKGRIGPIVLGAGAGPGFTSGPGTPAVRVVASVAYAPIDDDRDHDGVLDKDDACPEVPGVRTSDPATNGCPPPDRDRDGVLDQNDACPDTPGMRTDDPRTNGCPDRDGDGILDKDDACPDVKGIADADPKKNGCPVADRDNDGIPDDKDACPEIPGVADADPKKNGCPTDRDGDGVFDKDDACPDVKGAASADPKKNGCPPDTDDDGIPDDKDACPKQPGKPDPDPKKNGCPTVFITETKIEIFEQVQFKTGSDVILPSSDDLLTKVATILQSHPEITKMLIEGHTDDRGGNAVNVGLSQRRAASVKKWLVKKGIDAKRLDAKGFGQDRPISDNATEEGRQKNRRVEFKILETAKPGEVQAAPATTPPAPAPVKSNPGGAPKKP